MGNEIMHFTEAPGIMHFPTVKVSKNDNAYGVVWGELVRRYLSMAYPSKEAEVVSDGATYKVLRRKGVTVFYDAAGDTLFDVTNERLEKEYEWLMNGAVGDTAEDMDAREGDEPVSASDVTGENAESEQEAPGPIESKGIRKQDSRPAKQLAEEKLKKELAVAKDRSFAEPIIGYLLERCREDESLAEDVVQEHKTWQKCFDHIYSLARKQTNGNCAAVRDAVVYEWAEDYYNKDDKAEEERKAKKAAEDKAKRERSAAERKAVKAKRNTDKVKKAPAPSRPQIPKAPPKLQKNGKEMDGQLDLFAMMGM